MKNTAIENLLSRAEGSVYKLVRMASMRALELAEGRPKLVENITTDKLTTIALEEIYQGKVETKGSADNRAKEEKARAKEKS